MLLLRKVMNRSHLMSYCSCCIRFTTIGQRQPHKQRLQLQLQQQVALQQVALQRMTQYHQQRHLSRRSSTSRNTIGSEGSEGSGSGSDGSISCSKSKNNSSNQHCGPIVTTSIRLNKLLSNQGWGSRREIDSYIEAGFIQVDGITITRLGTQVPINANITLSSDAVENMFQSSSSASSVHTTGLEVENGDEIEKEGIGNSNNIKSNNELLSMIHRSKTTVILNKPLGYVSCQPDNYGSSILRHNYTDNNKSTNRSINNKMKHKTSIQLLTATNHFRGGGVVTSNNNNNYNTTTNTIFGSSNDYNDENVTMQNQNQQQQRQQLLQQPTSSTKNNSKVIMIEPYKLSKMGVVGRLDINSTGLLLFTQCGILARSIVGPNSTVEKEYLVRVMPIHTKKHDTDYFDRYDTKNNNNNSTNNNDCTDSTIEGFDVQVALHRLREGIIDRDTQELLEAKFVTIQHQPNIGNQLVLNFILTSGKYHHIRRMCKAVGLQVLALKRVRIGTRFTLQNLPLGKWKYC